MTGKPRFAYLLSRYPAVSHTFFLNEVLGLRTLGVDIATASINAPDRPTDKLSDQERDEAAQTFYVKGQPKLRAIASLLRIILTQPQTLLRGLSAVARIPGLTLRSRLFWLAYLAEALLVGEWMRRNHHDHLHVHFGGAVATVGMLTSQAWRIPYSLTIHGPEELQNMASYHLRQKLAQASFVVCISDFCRSQLQQITPPAQWCKFKVIRLGVDPALLQRTATHGDADGTESNPAHLLCVGRLVPEKGQRLLLQAVQQLHAQGLHVRLTLAGDGVDRPALQQEAQSLLIADRVTFAGSTPHSSVLDWCATADIFVLPSFAEGIPVALMEAMALETPCVSTTVAGIPELIETGVHGLLVPPSSLEALTAALATLTRDAALRRQLGQAARQRVLDDYNLEHNLQTLADYLQEKTRHA